MKYGTSSYKIYKSVLIITFRVAFTKTDFNETIIAAGNFHQRRKLVIKPNAWTNYFFLVSNEYSLLENFMGKDKLVANLVSKPKIDTKMRQLEKDLSKKFNKIFRIYINFKQLKKIYKSILTLVT